MVLALAAALSACGASQIHTAASGTNNGVYVTLGTVSYQLQVSRELNQYSVEDHQYLAGLPAGTAGPSPNQLWYGVFLYAVNESKRTATTSDSFYIKDTQNNTYYPVPLNSAVNPYAWTAQALPGHATEPGQDTTAYFGPTQGGLILFKLPTAVYANRPLTLYIQNPAGGPSATISLDL